MTSHTYTQSPRHADSLFDQLDQLWQNCFADPQPYQDTDFLRPLDGLPELRQTVQNLLLTRQVHALEHATVWILSGTPKSTAYRTITQDNDRLGGLSTADGFYLFGPVDTETLNHAVHKALHRLINGEWHLAVHPRCGTNLAVKLALSASIAMGGHFILPKDPLSQFLGLGTTMTLANQLTPIVGDWLQAHITTAIPFNLAIRSMQPIQTAHGSGHFIQTAWREID
jgi:hypothetical protein